MKPLLTFLLLFYFLPLTFSQAIQVTDIPTSVMDRFTLSYPDAKNITWQTVEGRYLAVFKNYKLETLAILSIDGTLYKTETEIKITALPEAATAYLAEKCKEKKIEEAVIIEDQSGVITFEAQVERMDYTFDANGRLLSLDEVAIGSKGN